MIDVRLAADFDVIAPNMLVADDDVAGKYDLRFVSELSDHGLSP